MPRQAILLRGINLGAINKVPMPALREALTTIGLGAVRTYLQSGNVVVDSDLAAGQLAELVRALVLDKFAVAAPTVIRTRAQMLALVDGNPYPRAAVEDPKHYTVSFLSGRPARHGLELIEAWRGKGETVAVSQAQTEVFALHPDGIHLSKLARQLTERKLGVQTATARNWSSVIAILALLQADE